MTFDMYVYGSLDAYLGILNAVAMVFNQGGFMQGVYLLGGLLMLTLVLTLAASYTAGPQQILKYVAVFSILVSTSSIKATLNVQDIYTGQLNRVDNIPLVLALPASLATTTVYGILTRTSTAYQGANASYVSISQGGFMDPLKELLALRTAIYGNKPLADSIVRFSIDCWSNGRATGDEDGLGDAANGLKYMLTNGSVPAWTVSFINATNKREGDVMVCASAADKIWAESQSWILREAGGSASLPSLAGTVAKIKPWVGPRVGGGKPTLTASDLNGNAENTLRALGIASASQQDMMLNLLSVNLVSEAFDCIQGSGGSPMNMATCVSRTTAMTQAQEQWKADAAGNASFFQGIMMPATMFIQMLAIALFPLMLIVAILSPGRAIQILMAFVLLMVWSASWPVVAVSVQWVMQLILNADLTNFKGTGLTYNNVASFYATVSKNLGIGADMMAATPLIAMALLTGSAFAYTQFASRWSADRVPEKLTTPDLQAPSAVQNVAPSQNWNPAAGGGIMPDYQQRTLSASTMAAEQSQSAWNDMVRDARTLSQSSEKGSRSAGEFLKANAEVDKYAADVAESVGKRVNLQQSQVEGIKSDIKAGIHAGIGVGPSIDASLSRHISSETHRSAVSDHIKNNSVTMGRGESIEKRFSESMSNYKQATEGTGYQHGVERARSYSVSASNTASTAANSMIGEADFGAKIAGLSAQQQASVQSNLTMIRTMLARPENKAIADTVKAGHYGDQETRAAFGDVYAAARSGNAQLQRAAFNVVDTLSGGPGSNRTASDNSGLASAPTPAPLWTPGKGMPSVGPVSAPGQDQVSTGNAAAGREATRHVNPDSIQRQGLTHDQRNTPLTGGAALANVVTSGAGQIGRSIGNDISGVGDGATIVNTNQHNDKNPQSRGGGGGELMTRSHRRRNVRPAPPQLMTISNRLRNVRHRHRNRLAYSQARA